MADSLSNETSRYRGSGYGEAASAIATRRGYRISSITHGTGPGIGQISIPVWKKRLFVMRGQDSRPAGAGSVLWAGFSLVVRRKSASFCGHG
jgi:hypothetical protein